MIWIFECRVKFQSWFVAYSKVSNWHCLRFSCQEAASFTFHAVRNTAKLPISMLDCSRYQEQFLERLSGGKFFEIRLLENPFDHVIENWSSDLHNGSYRFASQWHLEGQFKGRQFDWILQMPSIDFQYVHLRKFAHEFTSFWDYLGQLMWTDIFKDEVCEILVETNFIWWTFTILTYDKNHKLWTSAGCNSETHQFHVSNSREKPC